MQGGRQAQFPQALKDKMHGLRFFPVNPPSFLNHAGAEILLIGIDHGANNSPHPVPNHNHIR